MEGADVEMRSDGMGLMRNPYKTHTGIKKQAKIVLGKSHKDRTRKTFYLLVIKG